MNSKSTLLDEIKEIVGDDNLSVQPSDRVLYATDMWPKGQIWRLQGQPAHFMADAIVRPANAQQVAGIIRACAANKTPLIPYGGGSGVCGGTLPHHGGVMMDLKRMSRILEIDADRHLVHAEAGLIGEVLERTLNAAGFTLGHFPSSIYCSTVGGWVATRSAGQYSTRYGKIEDMVTSLEFIDGAGNAYDTRQWDNTEGRIRLAPLIVGSEGILGVITSATLKIHPIPELKKFRGLMMPGVGEGLALIQTLMQQGAAPLVLRMYDPFDTFMCGLQKHSDTEEETAASNSLRTWFEKNLERLPSSAHSLLHDVERAAYSFGLSNSSTLNRLIRITMDSCLMIVGYDGDAESVEGSIANAVEEAIEVGGVDLGEGPGMAWLENRHRVSFKAAPIYKLGAFVDTMEVVTTYDNLHRLYQRVMTALSPLAVTMAHFSHAYGTGCSIYFTFSAKMADPYELERRYDEVWRTAMNIVAETGGILSHHHGIGLSKRDRMVDEIGAGVEVIRNLKKVLDPQGILNPGKLIP